jgi:hypothetical protein
MDTLSLEAQSTITKIVDADADTKYYIRYDLEHKPYLRVSSDERILLNIDLEATGYFDNCKLCNANFKSKTWNQTAIHINGYTLECCVTDEYSRLMCVVAGCNKKLAYKEIADHCSLKHPKEAKKYMKDGFFDLNLMRFEHGMMEQKKQHYRTFEPFRRRLTELKSDCDESLEGEICVACALPLHFKLFHKSDKGIDTCVYSKIFFF